MRQLIFTSLFLLTVMFSVVTANAQNQRLAGTYLSENPETTGITRIEISEDGAINVWGRCHPNDCDWGPEAVVAYAPDPESSSPRVRWALTATYAQRHAVTVLIMRPSKDDQLRVDVFTRFTDDTGRTPYTRKEIFVREN